MPYYTVPFKDIATAAVAGQFKTFVALIVANTLGHRCRVVKVELGGDGQAPVDESVCARIVRTNQDTGGTGTDAVIGKVDNSSIASVVTAKVNFTAEPTTIQPDAGAPYIPWQTAMNSRASREAPFGSEGPRAGRAETLLLQLAPGQAVATKYSGSVTFETY